MDCRKRDRDILRRHKKLVIIFKITLLRLRKEISKTEQLYYLRNLYCINNRLCWCFGVVFETTLFQLKPTVKKTVVIEESINQSNVAMTATHAKASGNSHSQDTKGKGKRKKCTNCKHLKEDCFQKGRGKADNPPTGGRKKLLIGLEIEYAWIIQFFLTVILY